MMTYSLLFLLLTAPASADPTAVKNALATVRAGTAADTAPASPEDASVHAGKTFEQITIQTLAPEDEAPVVVAPDKGPTTPDAKPAATAPANGDGADYYFDGKKPLNGITIYTPVKGQGSTSSGDSPTAKYGKYGKAAIIAGLVLGGVGLALGGAPLVALAVIAGLLIGAGAVLSFLFGGKKK